VHTELSQRQRWVTKCSRQ